MLNTWKGRRSVGGTSEVWSLCSGVHCCEDFPPYILCPSRFLCPFCKRCTWEESLRETVVKLIVFICQSLNRSSQLYAGSGLVHINTTQRPLNHTGYTGTSSASRKPTVTCWSVCTNLAQPVILWARSNHLLWGKVRHRWALPHLRMRHPTETGWKAGPKRMPVTISLYVTNVMFVDPFITFILAIHSL